jgi:hypothetical protein
MLIKGGGAASATGILSLAKTGEDLTGNHGDANRTYDLPITSVGEQVFIQGKYLHPVLEYTKSVVGGVSRLTFLSKIYNQMNLIVYYWS